MVGWGDELQPKSRELLRNEKCIHIEGGEANDGVTDNDGWNVMFDDNGGGSI